MSLRPLAGELRWMLDPTDPLRAYNRRLAWQFATHNRATVVADTHLILTGGHMEKAQARSLQRLMLHQPWVREVAEVGFNGGHSSYTFLDSRPDVRVTSFDLGTHDYIDLTKSLIDSLFPGRHELVIGDSRSTVPAFAEAHPDHRFDLIFIDGIHTLEAARADIENCRFLASERAVIVMDDLERHKDASAGVVQAWLEAQHDGVIHQDVVAVNGFPVVGALDEIETSGAVWALGHYRQRDTDPTAPSGKHQTT
jgi:predicted O-methyltransferase YrrM